MKTHLRNKELVTRAILAANEKDSARVKQIYKKYSELNFKKDTNKDKYIASLMDVGPGVIKSVTFRLIKPERIKIEGTGEMCSIDGSEWCDYGWIENTKGKIIWEMPNQPFEPAGGALKNQHVKAEIKLNMGTYTLKYKSDGGHAFNSWDDLPPDHFLWGIRLKKL